jgi:hypothetical protein
MDERTAEQILQDYTAMGHSVAFITDVIAGNFMAEDDAVDRQSCVDRNVEHLELMRAKEDWGNEDFVATDSAINAGNAYVA